MAMTIVWAAMMLSPPVPHFFTEISAIIHCFQILIKAKYPVRRKQGLEGNKTIITGKRGRIVGEWHGMLNRPLIMHQGNQPGPALVRHKYKPERYPVHTVITGFKSREVEFRKHGPGINIAQVVQ